MVAAHVIAQQRVGAQKAPQKNKEKRQYAASLYKGQAC